MVRCFLLGLFLIHILLLVFFYFFILNIINAIDHYSHNYYHLLLLFVQCCIGSMFIQLLTCIHLLFTVTVHSYKKYPKIKSFCKFCAATKLALFLDKFGTKFTPHIIDLIQYCIIFYSDIFDFCFFHAHALLSMFQNISLRDNTSMTIIKKNEQTPLTISGLVPYERVSSPVPWRILLDTQVSVLIWISCIHIHLKIQYRFIKFGYF